MGPAARTSTRKDLADASKRSRDPQHRSSRRSSRRRLPTQKGMDYQETFARAMAEDRGWLRDGSDEDEGGAAAAVAGDGDAKGAAAAMMDAE